MPAQPMTDDQAVGHSLDAIRESIEGVSARYAGDLAAARADVTALQASLATATGDVTGLRTQLESATARATAAEKALADYKATHPDPKPEQPQPPMPPVVTKRIVIGMATEDAKWSTRLAAVGGKIGGRRKYASAWSISKLLADAKAIHDAGQLPVVSMKFSPWSWADVVAGKADAAAADLGKQLGALGFEVLVAFHHEPRDSATKTPEALKPWGQANERILPIVKKAGGDLVKVGFLDNGYPWGVKFGNLTDAELAVYLTDGLLEVCDFAGGDFYNGATKDDPTNGESAVIKMVRFEAWADRRGFDGLLVAGEWNFVHAEECDALTAYLKSTKRSWVACLFNSAANNRTDLPPMLAGSWELRGDDRLAAFKRQVAAFPV